MNFQHTARDFTHISYLDFYTFNLLSFSPAPQRVNFASQSLHSQTAENLQGRRACISGDKMRRCGAGAEAGAAVAGAAAVVVEAVVAAEGNA